MNPGTSEQEPVSTPGGASAGRNLRAALVGLPNTGKTTLFNRLSGLRHKTGNFPGTTQEARLGLVRGEAGGPDIELIDLPGTYSLELDQSESAVCRGVLEGSTAPAGERAAPPDVLMVVTDATNLYRGLLIVGEALRRRLPTVVLLNMSDLARSRRLAIDVDRLETLLGCAAVACSARTGEGLDRIRAAAAAARVPNITPPGAREGLEQWAARVHRAVTSAGPQHRSTAAAHHRMTDRLDGIFTHRLLGAFVFAGVMFGVFWVIFSLAQVPMNLMKDVFGATSAWLRQAMPEGILREFLAGGVVNGLSGTLVFLPQICLLFFMISLLEDTGYLARGAFVVNRLLSPFGLSGHAFVPLLSSHACALPGIMATRAIPDPRERLAAILIAPFMSCSARIPVYVLLITLLFPARPAQQALAFCGCYGLGIAAGLLSSLVARRTILRGPARPMALELPSYKIPSVRTALLTTWDRARVFLRTAGTNILAICVLLWWLSAYPKSEPPAQATQMRALVRGLDDTDLAPVTEPAIPRNSGLRTAGDVRALADRLEHAEAMSRSFAGRMGRAVQPVFAPLGYDWKLTVGVVTSFAAREVFVSTMAIITTGDADDAPDTLDAIGRATRDDGVTPIFTRATSWSLLVYYVLAMQCLPTLAVTAKEAGGVKWAALQLGWMSGLAYAAAWAVRAALLSAAGAP